MQLVLELLKKIFVALQGVYTKQETDAALAEIDLQRVIDAQSSRNVVMSNILTIAKAPVDNVHPLLLMGDFSSRIGSVNTTTGQISGFVNETMPQGDGTFVVTNRVSGGPLELSEDGTAPSHAVSLGQLTKEAQARQEAGAKHDAELNAMKVYANSISGGAILMYVDIPPDDGSTEYWKTDPVDFHRYYELKIQRYLGNFTIDWGDGIVESLSYSTMTNPIHRYVNTGRQYILVHGEVSKVYMSVDATTTKEIPAAISAKISLVLATLESVSSISGAFSGFLGGDVFLDLRNCTEMNGTFVGAKMNRVVANTSQKSVYHLFRTGTFDSVVFTEERFADGSQPMYAAIRKIVCRNCLRTKITTYFLHYSRNVLEEFYFEAPLLERITGAGLTHGFSNRPNFRVMGFGLPSLKNGGGLFENTNLDKASVLRILNALPDRTGVGPEQDGDGVITFTSNVATAAINNIDAELQSAIDAARNKNWTVEV